MTKQISSIVGGNSSVGKGVWGRNVVLVSLERGVGYGLG